MNTSRLCRLFVVLAAWSLFPTTAHAQRAFAEAYSDVLEGDLARTGNSVMTCDRNNESNGRCNQIESTTGTPTFNNNDTYTEWIDVDGFVDEDNDTNDDTFNSSTGTLSTSAAGVIEWAGLYWNGNDRATGSRTNTAPLPQNEVLIRVPGSTSYVTITADWCSDIQDRYQCFADVSAIAALAGAGDYTVANVSANTGQDDYVGGWELVVAYRDPAEPLRSLSVFHGHQQYAAGNSETVVFSGFVTPLTGPIDATLTLSVNEGDAGSGDNATFQCETCGSATTLSTDLGNGSFSDSSGNITTRNPAYRNTLGLDIDIFDVGTLMNNGDTEATVDLPATPGEVNEIYKVDFSVDVYFPLITNEKSVSDLNGGDVVPGDTLRYSVTVSNAAGATIDDAVNLIITDPLPTGITYVPGSLNLTESTPSGPATGVISDTAGNDVGEYDSNTRTITMRLGDGATSSAGGQLDAGESVTFTFDVTIDQTGTPSSIVNEAIASYEGNTLSSGGVTRVNDTPSNDPDTGPYDGTGVVVLPDEDGDGLGDTNDGDTDNDGILDIDEGGGIDPSADTDGDLIPDWNDPDTLGFVDVNNDTVDDRFDFDFDGIPNHLDLDSDGDGLFDIAETSSAALDANGDGRIDDTTDTDGDGVLDGVDPDDGGIPSILTNSDTDAAPDFLDVDDDGDGILTATEIADGLVHGNNPDNDAFPNWLDTDSDGDMVDDADETDDVDLDLVPDYLDDTIILIATPADNTVTNDSQISIAGQTEAAASVVIVFRNSVGVVVETVNTTAGGIGFWNGAPTSALPDDTYTVEVTVTDSTGNSATDSISVTVDTAAGTLTVVTPANAASVQNTVVSGTAEPGATVTVVFDQGTANESTVTTTADGTTGAYSATPATPLTEGIHTVDVTAVDGANNTAGPETRTFNVDRTNPTVSITTPANGATVSDATITGTTEPGATVSVVIDSGTANEQTLSALADVNGDWSVSPTVSEGAHTIQATPTDAAGNVGAAANSTFTLDSTAPASLTAQLVNGMQSGTVNSPAVTGLTEPGATVTLVFDAGTANEQTKVVTADPAGNYTASPDNALADGSHTVDVSAADAAGNSIGPVSLTFDLDTMVPALAVTTPNDGDSVATDFDVTGTAEPGATVTVTLDAGTPAETTTTVTADGAGDWTVMASVAAAGAHTVDVEASDAAGNTATVPTINVTVSGATLAITEPLDGSVINDNTPALVGTANAGATVTIVLDAGTADEQTISVVANSNGDWFFFSPVLADGTHTVDASTDDGAGGMLTDSVSFEIDSVPPTIAISSPADGSSTNDTTPLIEGTTDNDLIIDIYIDGVFVDTAAANAIGEWTYTVPDGNALADGLYEFEAVATDAAGNEARASINLTIDTVAPTVTIDSPADGATVGTMPALSGTTEPGAEVEITLDGAVVATVTANSSGTWTYTPAALADGSHSLSVVATDAAGNASGAASSTFSVDSTLPVVTISEPADGSVTRETLPVVTGTADANADVEISVDGNVVDSVMADANGDWSYTIMTALAEGNHTVTASVTEIVTVTASSTFEVDTTPPPLTVDTPMGGLLNDDTPTITGTTEPNATVNITLPDGTTVQVVADGNGDFSYAVTSPLPEGPGTIDVYAQDPAGNNSTVSVMIEIDVTAPAVSITNPDDDATKNSGSVEYRGTSDPGQEVELYVDGNLETTVTADANGEWVYASPTVLADGVHTLDARAVDAAGNEGVDSVDFIIDTRSPSLEIVTPAEGETFDTGDFTVSGTTDANQVVTILVDGTEVGTATADADGDWSLDVTGITMGDHVVRAEADDGNGNIANDEVNISVTDDSTNPMMGDLTITRPQDGDSTNDQTPTIEGTGTPGTTIEVFIDGTKVGEVVVDDDGTWEFTPEDDLTEGDHTVEVVVTFPDGSTETVEVVVTIDTTPPDGEITTPADGDETTDQPAITGTAEPGATVEVFIDGESIGETEADNNGDWTITPPEGLDDGPHEVTAIVTDDAGNSTEIGPVEFTSKAPDSTDNEFNDWQVAGGQYTCSAASNDAPTGWLALIFIGLIGVIRRRK